MQAKIIEYLEKSVERRKREGYNKGSDKGPAGNKKSG